MCHAGRSAQLDSARQSLLFGTPCASWEKVSAAMSPCIPSRYVKLCAALSLCLLAIISAVMLLGCAKETVSPLDDPPPKQESSRYTTAGYAGSAACRSCHPEQNMAWSESDHDLAMQVATVQTVLGDFKDATVRFASETFTFRRTGDDHEVEVLVGKTSTSYPVRYVFGIDPLQQLLVDVGNGHLQALTVAWDTRSEEKGGQHWFHLYPDQAIAPEDPLHWKGPQFTWNFMCADCHSTGVSKNYQRSTKQYDTEYEVIDVGCEACHGPGAGHVAAARDGRAHQDVAGFRSLRRTQRWAFTEGVPIATRIGETSGDAELEVCAPCHSRRTDLGPGRGNRYHDRYRLALLEEELYFADGRMKDEVFVFGSFLQSRMHAAGVTCSDCHDAHTLSLVAEGNHLCTRCHQAQVYDTSKHHFHPSKSEGSQCVSCHMPERNYMVVDGRRDHRFAIPRPLLSQEVGSPDPCMGCHREQTAEWATIQIAKRFGTRAVPELPRALHLARTGMAGAKEALLRVFERNLASAIARATVVAELARFPSSELVAVLNKAATDKSPLVRRTAASVAATLPGDLGLAMATALSTDTRRSVRIESAAALLQQKTPKARRALDEYEQALRFRSDRTEGLLDLARVRAADGDVPRAKRYLREALARDPSFSPTYVNLADLHQALGDEEKAESILVRGLEHAADPALIRHALGLSRIRLGETADALRDLEAAHREQPADTRYAYVYAIALHDSGEPKDALRVLRMSLAEAPTDESLLLALIDYCRQQGLHSEASDYARRLETERSSTEVAPRN